MMKAGVASSQKTSRAGWAINTKTPNKTTSTPTTSTKTTTTTAKKKATKAPTTTKTTKTTPSNTTSPEVLWKESVNILADVDRAELFQRLPPREFPTFLKSELKFGKILGVGGFCTVSEITGIALEGSDGHESSLSSSPTGKCEMAPSMTTTTTTTTHHHHHVEDENAHYDCPDVTKTREYMRGKCQRGGRARYAVKRLRTDLPTELERVRGRIDLAIETKFLRSLDHPNIVKMRAYAFVDVSGRRKGGGGGANDHDDAAAAAADDDDAPRMTDPGHFIVLDRLYGTLEDRFDEWRDDYKRIAGGRNGGALGRIMGRARRRGRGDDDDNEGRDELRELMLERLVVAYDLAAALRYMHENRLVYRDLKPENIGFDIRNDVKVFDLGLAKSLSPELKVRNSGGLYRLTGRTGSFPYMAPEVAQCRPYNAKCDVFSFAMLLWEILSLRTAFPNVRTRLEFYERIALRGERPPISSGDAKSWPSSTRQGLVEGWDRDAMKRPTVSKLAGMIRADMNRATDERRREEILHRTHHMANRSMRSMRGFVLPPSPSTTTTTTTS